MPNLRALVQRMQDKPFAVIGVNAYDSDIDFRDGVKKHGATWPAIFQGGLAPVGDLYRVVSYPTSYVLDAEGRIVAKDLKGEDLVRKVEELVAALESAGQ